MKNEENLLEQIWSTKSIISNDLVDVVAHNSGTEKELDKIEKFEGSIGVYNRDENTPQFYHTKKTKKC